MSQLNQKGELVMTDEQYIQYTLFSSNLRILLGAFGAICNSINIKTFATMGLRDAVTMSFLVLSLSQLGVTMFNVGNGLPHLMSIIEIQCGNCRIFPIAPHGVSIINNIMAFLFTTTTGVMTTFLSFIRFMCVAKPLHFKNMFTKKLVVLIGVGSTAVSMTLLLPVVAHMGIIKHNISDPTGRPELWISPSREFIRLAVFPITDVMFPVTSHVIVIISIIGMVTSLKKSTSFRHKCTKTKEYIESIGSKSTGPCSEKNEMEEGDSNHPYGHQTNVCIVNTANRSNSSPTLSGKELQVVLQVIVISAVHLASNIPGAILSIVNSLVPGLILGGRLNNIYNSIYSTKGLFECFNSSVSFVIYYRYNRKFRKLCSFK